MASKDKLVYLCKNKGIEYFTDDKFIYAKKGKDTFRLAVFDNNYYKLRIYNGIPVLEIDGLRMHLVKDFETPLDYSKEIASKLKITADDIVLDTCMGLGYTAIEASKAKKTITFEISDSVYLLATWNPWSDKLFSKNIEIRRGDIAEEITELKDNSFSVIIHDPPRFSKAPNLYSLRFYQELFRIACPKARIFHYVGSVGQAKGRKISEEVEKRLKRAGFTEIKYDKKLQGLLFRKQAVPRR